jgi:hypothetical protein
MTSYIFQRGETITLALDAVAGDPLAVTGITAHMKAVPPGRSGVAANTPVAAAFSVAPRPMQDALPAGWTLTIDAATSAGLVAGPYLADARLQIGTGVVITEAVAMTIRESVSA